MNEMDEMVKERFRDGFVSEISKALGGIPLTLEQAEAIMAAVRKHKDVVINFEHAYSLTMLAKYFKAMIEAGNLPTTPERSDELTVAYCDELIEGLSP